VRERNFFPGYVIISADLSHGEALHLINDVPGVLGFLGSGEKKSSKVPVPLRQSEINRILGKVEDEDLADERMIKPFIIGETVKVMDGNLKN
jgi:transcriptional antiterminator NusG